MILTVYVASFLSFNPLLDILKRSTDNIDYLGYIFAAIPAVIAIIAGFKLKNKVRAWKIFIGIILGIGIMALMVILGTNPASAA